MCILTNTEPSVGGKLCYGPSKDGVCGRPVNGKGLCRTHRAQQIKGAELTPIREYRKRRKVHRHDPSDMLCEVPPGHQSCTECGVIQPLDNFSIRKNRGQMNSICRTCSAEQALDNRYGDGASAEKKKMLAEQGGLCGICKTDDPRDPNGWHLDHDHDTDELRGVLCLPCNIKLGHIENTIKNGQLDAMLDYIRTGGESSRA